MDIRIHYALDFLALGLIFAALYFRKIKSRDKWYKLLFSLNYLYFSLVLFVTLMPFQLITLEGNEFFMQKVNFVPFNDIILGHLGARRETALNILMFLPLGFFLPQLIKPGFLQTSLLGFCTSLFIEAMQLLYLISGTVYLRAFDVTDLINNTLGAMLGYIIYLILRPCLLKLEGRVSR